MQVSVWGLGDMAGTVEMKGLRKEKGVPEGTEWDGETEMLGSLGEPRRVWEKGRPLEGHVDL